MNIRSYISRQLSSKTVRRILSLKYKDNHSYKLLFGHLKGSKMIYHSDTNFRVDPGSLGNGFHHCDASSVQEI